MIYNRIKELAKKNDISINALEKKIGVSRGSLCKIDSHKPSSEKIKKLADELHTSVDYLLNGEDNAYSKESAHLISQIRSDAELTKALIKYFSFNDEKKKHIIETINLLSEENK